MISPVIDLSVNAKETFLQDFVKIGGIDGIYPDQEIREAVANGLWANKDTFRNAKKNAWPKLYSCRFIEPGLVHYQDYGMVLVQKPVLDKMMNSFVGKPVVNVVHKDVTPDHFREEADGVITKVWYNDSDGWYWADFLVWDKATMHNCESNAYSVSCAYAVNKTNEKAGEYHNIPYAQEVLDGEYTHMAVVANPRYEGARIVYNSKGGSMKLFNWFKKGEAKTPADIEKAVVDVDGKKVTVKELIDVHNTREAAGKSTSETLENMSDDTIIEIDGKEMPLKNLKDAYRKNAEEEEEKEKENKKSRKNEEDKKKEEEEAKNRKNAEDEEKKKKEKDLENAKKAEEEEKARKGAEHFNSLQAAANRRGEPQQPVLTSRRELAAAGKEKYGEKKVA
jgi:hypothetical protein